MMSSISLLMLAGGTSSSALRWNRTPPESASIRMAWVDLMTTSPLWANSGLRTGDKRPEGHKQGGSSSHNTAVTAVPQQCNSSPSIPKP